MSDRPLYPGPPPRRRITLAQPKAEHELVVTFEPGSRSHVLVRCRCGAVGVRQRCDDPPETMLAAYLALDHRPALEATA